MTGPTDRLDIRSEARDWTDFQGSTPEHQLMCCLS